MERSYLYMAKSKDQSHMTLENRKTIETGISNGSKKSSIADTIGKDASTVGKEIKNHRSMTYKSSLPLDCDNYKKCSHGRNCSIHCVDYKPFKCTRRDRSPGACNGCSNYTHCRHTKYYYDAHKAQEEYEKELVDSRQGVNLTTDEATHLGNIIKPLLEQGQSPYQIVLQHPELGITERTLYNYLENDVFRVVGITIMDLRRKVSRKPSKNIKKNTLKKREDRKYLKGREYKNFQEFMEENPNANVVEMDTVYNDGSNGPFIQTFKFLKYGFLFAILHDEKTSEAMIEGINTLEQLLSTDIFCKEITILLTDRGSEFVKAEEMEASSIGVVRTRVFYCDPMASHQKGSLENNHIELRYILPKENDLRALGLINQDKMNLALSHINSMPKEKLNGKSPIELMEFLNPSLVKKFFDFGLTKIDSDKVILKPYLLK